MPSPCPAPHWRTGRPRLAAPVTVLAIALTVNVLQAQADSTIATKDSTATLETVIVRVTGGRAVGYHAPGVSSALRTDAPLRDTPLSVTTVTSALMADQRLSNLADAMRFVPGVTMGQGEGHRDQPTIRGNNTTADFFVDGIRDDAQYIRDTYNAERIESIRGSNAVTFGRGGGGGVINRVTKEARWAPITELSLEAGAHDHKRATLDIGRASATLAGRLNMVYHDAETYRDAVRLERFGINPTLTAHLGANTTLRASYEFFDDHRTVDRGIPSFRGAPAPTSRNTFFGNPDSSYYDARVQAASVVLQAGSRTGVSVQSNTRFGRYDKFYQNVFPGAVDAAGERVALAAYSNATLRTSLINQTDVVAHVRTGGVTHTLLAGAELGRSVTDNLRKTGYFDSTSTSLQVAFDAPNVAVPVAFRPSPTDADAHVVLNTAAVLVQDQAAITPWLHAIAGARVERFDLAFRNNRNGGNLSREDVMVSPRAGLVVKPVTSLSLYGSYSVSFLPSAGDQYASLNVRTESLEPERFTNEEIGVKWEPDARLSLTGAIYRLDRTNTAAAHPTNPALLVQTGEQRSTGVELTATGYLTRAWEVVGVYANQVAKIRSATSAAPAGASVPLVPRVAASLWNRYEVTRALGLGLGLVHQTRSYAAIDNSVILPGFTRVDAAVYATARQRMRLQLNVENLFDTFYHGTAHSNNNITPGAPRTVRLSATLFR